MHEYLFVSRVLFAAEDMTIQGVGIIINKMEDHTPTSSTSRPNISPIGGPNYLIPGYPYPGADLNLPAKKKQYVDF